MRIFLTAVIFLQSIAVFAQRICGSEEHHRHILANDVQAKKVNEEIEEFTRKYIADRAYMKTAGNIEVIIPVVFHVVYYNNDQNISDQRIHEQLEIINKDFNALNEDISNVPAPFRPLIGKMNVKFVLANRDPQGKVTSGITRYQTSRATAFIMGTHDVKKTSTGGVYPWDTRYYLNVWVCNLNGAWLGYSTFPSDAGKTTDGLVLSYKYTGKTGALKPFHFGRTATHELGHYFNLYHIWGDENDCTTDDGVADTPIQYTNSAGTPVFPKYDDCNKTSPGVMFMNYMDYSNDTALLMFTRLQATRMEAILNGARASLKSSKGYVAPVNFDLSTYTIHSPARILCENNFTPSVSLLSLGYEKITSFNISLQIGDGEIVTKSWSGELNLYDSVKIDFDPVGLANGSHDVKFMISFPNGQPADDNPANDVSIIGIQVGVESRTLPLNENFEDENISSRGFSVINSDNSITWKRSAYKVSKKGDYSYFMNNNEYNPDVLNVSYDEKDDIVLPFLDLREVDSAVMSFYLAAAQYTNVNQAVNNWDTLKVLVSVDCGATYDVIYNKYAKDLITVAAAVKTFFTPTASEWRIENLDLTPYLGYNNVMIVIRNVSNFENNIYIDDLKVNDGKFVSVREYVTQKDVEIYPNPSNGSVVLKINESSVRLKQVVWINALGQTVLDNSEKTYSNIIQFDLSNQAKGLYIAKLVFEDGSVTTKKLLLE